MPGVGTTHHVKIGGHYYLVKPGSYRKSVAPQFGARFTTGDPDYNNLSIWQHWAQRCFVGGMDATEFADDAMYDDGVGVDTTEHEMVTLSRDLARGSGANWSLGGTAYGRKFFVYNNTLFCMVATALGVAGHLWKYDPVSDGWSDNTDFSAQNIVPRSVAVFGGKVFIGGPGTAGGYKLIYASGTLSSWTTVANPAGVTMAPYAMRAFQGKLYVAYGDQLWRLKDDLTWDGNTVFYKASGLSDSNYLVSMEVHLGFLYLLSLNGHVHRTDGNSTFDIWNWDGQTNGVALRSFDGRLFIATNEYTADGSEGGYGVLYQMSGSAVTQLKRWGKDGEAGTLGSLMVADRRMFYGASNLLGMRAGFGIACYDPIEDAHSIIAANGDTVTYARGAAPYSNYMVDDVFYWGGYLWASVRGHGVFKTPYKYRDYWRGVRTYDTTAAGGAPGATNGGYFTTSTYDAGTPGLRKLWRKIIVDYHLPSADQQITVSFSPDAGKTWQVLTEISTANGATADKRERKEFFLSNQISVSAKLRFALRSTVGSQTPTLFGFIVSYIPVVEPNWIWQMTLVLSEKQHLLDGTQATVDTESELAFLRDTYRTKQMINFVDAEGTSWASGDTFGVIIYDLVEWLPDMTQPLEGEVQITLLEAVESY